MIEPVLSFKDLYKSYGDDSWVIRGLTTDIFRGERVLLTGKQNTGKTTLLKLASTLLSPTVGSIELFGDDVFSIGPLSNVRRNHFGLVLQEMPLIPKLSLIDNIILPLIPAKSSHKERLTLGEEILTRLEIFAVGSKLPLEVDRSHRFLALLARAFVNKPDFVLIDQLDLFLDQEHIPGAVSQIIGLSKENDTTLLLAQEPGELPENFDRSIKL